MTDIMREWNEALTAPKCEHGHLAPVCDLCKKDAEIARITAERDAAFAMSRCECATDEACAELAKLHAEVAGLREDAERYRWLRAGEYTFAVAQSVLNDTPHGIDAFIDRQLAARKGTT